jgi:hypothetical protein
MRSNQPNDAKIPATLLQSRTPRFGWQFYALESVWCRCRGIDATFANRPRPCPARSGDTYFITQLSLKPEANFALCFQTFRYCYECLKILRRFMNVKNVHGFLRLPKIFNIQSRKKSFLSVGKLSATKFGMRITMNSSFSRPTTSLNLAYSDRIG